MAELKKCPFCKSENLYIIHDKKSIKRNTFVECQNCKATAPIESWNNRATEAEIRAKAIEEFVEKFIYKVHCEGCSGCTNCYETGTQDNCDTYRYFAEAAEELKAEQLKGE